MSRGAEAAWPLAALQKGSYSRWSQKGGIAKEMFRFLMDYSTVKKISLCLQAVLIYKESSDRNTSSIQCLPQRNTWKEKPKAKNQILFFEFEGNVPVLENSPFPLTF